MARRGMIEASSMAYGKGVSTDAIAQHRIHQILDV